MLASKLLIYHHVPNIILILFSPKLIPGWKTWFPYCCSTLKAVRNKEDMCYGLLTMVVLLMHLSSSMSSSVVVLSFLGTRCFWTPFLWDVNWSSLKVFFSHYSSNTNTCRLVMKILTPTYVLHIIGRNLSSASLVALREFYKVKVDGSAHRARVDVNSLTQILPMLTPDLKLTSSENH